MKTATGPAGSSAGVISLRSHGATPDPEGGVNVVLYRRDVSGQQFDCSDVRELSISGCTVKGAAFFGLTGALRLGDQRGLSEFHDCIFKGCVIPFLYLNYVLLDRCRFIDCRILSFMTKYTGICDCQFSGLIKGGNFWLTKRNPRAEARQLSLAHACFEGNDFSECELRNVSFRGGIDVGAQTFGDRYGGLIIPNGPQFLDRWSKQVKSRSVQDRLSWLTHYVRLTVDQFGQRSVYIDGHSCKKLGVDDALVRSIASGR